IRYITLTHSKNNHICDSSYDKERKWNGLSPFGRELVAEMNRLGIIIDVSHISDSTFYQVMALSKAPVFASHSSCRHFTPDWERNMNDDMIRLLAENDGVICINFGSDFLKTEYQGGWKAFEEKVDEHKKETGLQAGSEKLQEFIHAERKNNPVGSVADVADHIDYVVKMVGVDHVGFGSDFDGVTFLPAGLDDVSGFPNLIAELLKRGYSEEDIEKICGGNTLRVWSAVEQVAAGMQAN
nr:membrane dipeptidase [Calditrichia bacterium]